MGHTARIMGGTATTAIKPELGASGTPYCSSKVPGDFSRRPGGSPQFKGEYHRFHSDQPWVIKGGILESDTHVGSNYVTAKVLGVPVDYTCVWTQKNEGT